MTTAAQREIIRTLAHARSDLVLATVSQLDTPLATTDFRVRSILSHSPKLPGSFLGWHIAGERFPASQLLRQCIYKRASNGKTRNCTERVCRFTG